MWPQMLKIISSLEIMSIANVCFCFFPSLPELFYFFRFSMFFFSFFLTFTHAVHSCYSKYQNFLPFLRINKILLYEYTTFCLPIHLLGFPGSSAGKAGKFACRVGDPSSIPGLGRSPGEGMGYPFQYSWASLVAQSENLPAVQETWVRSLGWEDPLEEGMAAHSSILAWRTPWTEEPDGLQPMGSQRVRHDQATRQQHLLMDTWVSSIFWLL